MLGVMVVISGVVETSGAVTATTIIGAPTRNRKCVCVCGFVCVIFEPFPHPPSQLKIALDALLLLLTDPDGTMTLGTEIHGKTMDGMMIGTARIRGVATTIGAMIGTARTSGTIITTGTTTITTGTAITTGTTITTGEICKYHETLFLLPTHPMSLQLN